MTEPIKNIDLIRNMLNEDLADFQDEHSENIGLIRELVQADIDNMDNNDTDDDTANSKLFDTFGSEDSEDDKYQNNAINDTVNAILQNQQALQNELVVVEAQIESGDDVENAKFIRDILINDIAELDNQIKTLTDFSNDK